MVHYGEIALKGKNRPDFENQLVRNIKQQHPGCRVQRRRGRLTVESQRPLDLGNVFGVAWWSEVKRVPGELEEIVEAALATGCYRYPSGEYLRRARQASDQEVRAHLTRT